MSFIKHFIRAWRDAKLYREYDVAADMDDGWNADDAKIAFTFFESATGLKLKKRLTNYVFQSAITATRATANHLYYNGVARGIDLSVNAIEQHLAPVEKKDLLASPLRSVDTSESNQRRVAADDLALR